MRSGAHYLPHPGRFCPRGMDARVPKTKADGPMIHFTRVEEPEMPNQFSGLPLAFGWFLGNLLVWYPVAKAAYEKQSTFMGMIAVVLFLTAFAVPVFILLYINGFLDIFFTMKDGS